jgi:hypothetical protein
MVKLTTEEFRLLRKSRVLKGYGTEFAINEFNVPKCRSVETGEADVGVFIEIRYFRGY